MKEMSEACATYLTRTWSNEIIGKHQFLDNLKLTDVTNVSKKEDRNLVKNYRPLSVLLVISKIFKRKLQKQIMFYIDKTFFSISMWLWKRLLYKTDIHFNDRELEKNKR